MKTIGWLLLAAALFVLGGIVGYNSALAKYRSNVVKLSAQVDIYKSEADKYAQTLRSIRETAAQATILEQAK